MKKILFFIAALAMFSQSAKALENEPEEGFTYMGLFGINVSKLQNDFLLDKAKAGVMMGARVDYVLPKAHGTYLTAGVDWTMKGGKTSVMAEVDEDIPYMADATVKRPLHYFEVPIRVGFRYNITEGIGVYGELGPYFAIGVGGKHKMSIDADGDQARKEEDDYSYKAFKNYDYNNDDPKFPFQRWDAGIGFRVGAEYNHHYNLLIGCDWGLADIYRTSLRDDFKDEPLNLGATLPKVHNFNLSITFGYRF